MSTKSFDHQIAGLSKIPPGPDFFLSNVSKRLCNHNSLHLAHSRREHRVAFLEWGSRPTLASDLLSDGLSVIPISDLSTGDTCMQRKKMGGRGQNGNSRHRDLMTKQEQPPPYLQVLELPCQRRYPTNGEGAQQKHVHRQFFFFLSISSMHVYFSGFLVL